MNSVSRERFDVLVIGAGPAGMGAAVTAAECGARVAVVDDNPGAGGQIWRKSLSDEEGGATGPDKQKEEAAKWSERLQTANVQKFYGIRVFDQPEPGTVLGESIRLAQDGGAHSNLVELRYGKLILATGARERFLPFPGWTLPNVMGAGGLQAMVKSGLPIRGKRVVIAGTGPLLLAVAAYLRKHGAEIPILCEQAPWAALSRFGAALLRYRGKLSQARQLKKELSGIPYSPNSWPLAAHGSQRLESVSISRNGKTEVIACDYLACGFHLVPNVEFPALLGCRLSAGYVQVDDYQQTSVNDVFCAGEPNALGGVDLALVEGQIAGLAAGGDKMKARTLFAARRKARRFARLLDRTFRLRAELKDLAAAETIVCRCEDVRYARLQEHRSWRAAKLQARCGMGPCQGRICGPATQFLFGWNADSVRPPVFPATVASLAKAISGR